MRIHIFNPEHDLALASNLDNFTAPHAGRDLRHDLGFLPALWAGKGDGVLVDNCEAAEYAFGKLGVPMKGVFVTPGEIPQLVQEPDSVIVQPWGWDRAVRGEFLRAGVPAKELPDDTYLNTVRQTSHRSWAAEHVLRPLREIPGTIGEAETARTLSEVRRFLSVRHHIVLKAPWSSSGRGVRYVSDGSGSNTTFTMTRQLEGWVMNILRRQGAILMEPYYNKVMDLGMEFYSDKNLGTGFTGLSLFRTVKGAYAGNLLASEDEKRERVARFLDITILDKVQHRLQETFSATISRFYQGSFGVDMMLVNNDGTILLHPCVELNLRMTMGHAALRMREIATKPWKDMRVVFKNAKYSLETM